MSNFRKALILTAIPIVVLFVVHFVVMYTVDSRFDVHIGEQIGWVASGLLVLALVAAIVFSIKGMKEIAKGTWLGFGIGLFPLIIMFIIEESASFA